MYIHSNGKTLGLMFYDDIKDSCVFIFLDGINGNLSSVSHLFGAWNSITESVTKKPLSFISVDEISEVSFPNDKVHAILFYFGFFLQLNAIVLPK